MFFPSFEEAQKLASDYNIIPITIEYPADMDTPISIFKRMETERFCFLLESVEGNRDMARYSFIGRNPFLIFKSYQDQITITDHIGKEEARKGDPIQMLKQLCEQYKSPVLPEIPKFSGGAVGYFAYDVIRFNETLPNAPENDLNQPDLHFMFTDELIIFDHHKQRLIILVNMHVEDDLKMQYERATKRIIEIQNEFSNTILPKNTSSLNYRNFSKPTSNMTKKEFCHMVESAKEYIKNGDIFQVVLSQRFEIETDVDPLNAYRAIRLINPSPYMYYLKFDDYQVAGASPEMLVRVEDGIVQTSPIAGTKPRGKTPEEDDRLKEELLADPKENAEHTMLVDLGRNDIGKVCKFDSVSVERYRYIQYFSHVMHMTSDIKGEMQPQRNVFDALCSVLPAGTLSGAPKVRAMEIIDEFEKARRGTYGGAIGYISFNGNLDSCITIRTALFKNGKAYVQAGGGIVYDSIAEKEYEESVNKAASMIQAIRKAGDM